MFAMRKRAFVHNIQQRRA